MVIGESRLCEGESVLEIAEGQEVSPTLPNRWTGCLRISSPPCRCKTAIRHVEKQHSVCRRYLGH